MKRTTDRQKLLHLIAVKGSCALHVKFSCRECPIGKKHKFVGCQTPGIVLERAKIMLFKLNLHFKEHKLVKELLNEY